MNQFRPVRTMGTPLDTEPASGGTINILGVVEVIWRRKLIILACTVMTMGGAWLALKRVTPVYTATSILLLDSRQPNVTNVRGVVSELSLTSSVVAGELAILRSNVLIGEVVDELDLMDHPQFAAPPPKEDSGGGIGKALSAWSDRIVAMLSGLKSETPAQLRRKLRPRPPLPYRRQRRPRRTMGAISSCRRSRTASRWNRAASPTRSM